ncbi:PDZ domain-containing protein [Actinoplanes sp. TBRC 11911]|uniref:trypsin-like peptidase domain-containing protein n=1 Tax=Actinoplanes sp. TBRC 11911 TaxID=2729386 RepID=UPI00145E71DE|nr:trypsin-like peptidase domain-containing protein [Actinoplanes sp. TBRC 11911]NMO50611.1 PDZ domain-containing protein [Actinoplanes sp. TBRC 11911]
MNENETDPQREDAAVPGPRPEAQSSEEPPAPEDPTVPVEPTTAPPAQSQSGAPQWASPATGEWATPASGEWASPATGEWAAPAAGAQMPPASAQPATGPQPPASPWQQQPQTPWHPGYPQPTQAYQQYPQATPQYPQSAYANWQHAAQHAAGGGQTPPPPAGPDGTTATWPSSDAQPVWAAPVGAAVQAPPRSDRRRKVLLGAAAAVVIALGAGGVGAATAMAFDDNGSVPAVQTGNSSVTRVVDRSSLAQIASAVQDSVVSITTQNGEGSGVVLTADGFIVTNNHVVATAEGSTVTVIFADGKKSTARIVGTDPRTDLAVVQVNGASGLQAAKFGSSAKMQVGDTVLAIGSPLGLEGSVTAGIVSAKDRTIQSQSEDDQQGQDQGQPFGGGQQQQQQGTSTTMSGLLQTDAPINPGNSGGALVNTNGEVIGINSAIATQGQGSGNIGLGFAIPSDKARQVADALMAGKKVSHPALGVSVAAAENGGALVSSVTPNSAASKAGLQQGDVITKVDGKTVSDSDDLVGLVQSGTVGQKMTITFTRDGAEKQVTVTLAESQ